MQNVVVLALLALQVGVKVFALVDALRHRSELYPAAGKRTKGLWLAILGVTLAVQVAILYPLNFLNIIGLVAAAVYLVDVRPALRSLTGRGGAGGQHMGPYGPW
ncbi:DUF2516 family protein [Vallicoccus soli]|uniref:DUF2516 family protein n=1 Tax=Vallicoccus soli TaxID=2339232 RepID=A0A3A3Z8V3_9ACTN|nr:DUF2516 family protein [Vallicoccus soli]